MAWVTVRYGPDSDDLFYEMPVRDVDDLAHELAAELRRGGALVVPMPRDERHGEERRVLPAGCVVALIVTEREPDWTRERDEVVDPDVDLSDNDR